MSEQKSVYDETTKTTITEEPKPSLVINGVEYFHMEAARLYYAWVTTRVYSRVGFSRMVRNPNTRVDGRNVEIVRLPGSNENLICRSDLEGLVTPVPVTDVDDEG